MTKSEKSFSPNYLIYGCLAEESAHGYEIHQRIENDLNYVWSLSQSQLYALLKRLENKQLIVGEMIPQEGRPDRKRFTLSPQAKQEYQKWLQSPVWVSMRSLRMELLAKIYFLSSQNPEAINPLIQNQVSEVEQTLHSIAHQLEKMPSDQTVNKISMQIKQAQIQMMLAYLKKLDVNQFRS